MRHSKGISSTRNYVVDSRIFLTFLGIAVTTVMAIFGGFYAYDRGISAEITQKAHAVERNIKNQIKPQLDLIISNQNYLRGQMDEIKEKLR